MDLTTLLLFIFTVILDVIFYPISIGFVFGIVALIVLLFISSLISGSESAFFSLNPTDLNHLKENPTKRNRIALQLLEKPEQLLASILITNNLVNVGIIILSAFLTASIVDFSNTPLLGFLVQVVVITFILLLFGEIIPKILATSKSLAFSKLMAFPLFILTKLLKPLNYLLVSSSVQMSRRFSSKRNISIDELSDALDITSGQLPEERKILKGIVTFGNKEVREIMKPRLDVVALDLTTGFNKLKSVVVESGYSRIPVYDQTFDEIRGVLYVKDLLPFIQESDDFQWQNLLREPYFIPESKRINALLSEFQTKRIHLAIVVDEYGGTCGIVTLEDILEEIVGEISDESDEEVALYSKLDDYNYFFEGKILLNDFCRIVNVDDALFDNVRGEAETLAGVILEITGLLPRKNDIINHKQFQFLIESVDNKRIKRVKVTIKKQHV